MNTEKSTAELAYQLWLERGRPFGSADDDWLEAERRLSGTQARGGFNSVSDGELDAALEDSFPASDPPASQLPDSPPSNAEEKWANAGAVPPPATPPPASKPSRAAQKKANS